ncbi:hypothetical protein L3X38_023615 [Prunus dulcis]|uniref:Uncharacterized protein n=1 Tax=Prunus dulcis TaxID=3755 RepID=A0AAD4VZU4_PRUDU|nr:hypothetical protein L3X38_023615 [Prunus dulcis]
MWNKGKVCDKFRIWFFRPTIGVPPSDLETIWLFLIMAHEFRGRWTVWCENCSSGGLDVSVAYEDSGYGRLGVSEACKDGVDGIILELMGYLELTKNYRN